MWGERLEAIGTGTRLRHERGPDYDSVVEEEPLLLEVYAPGLKPREDLIDDVRGRLENTTDEPDTSPTAYRPVRARVTLFIHETVKRNDRVAKKITAFLRRRLDVCARSGQFPAQLAFHGDLDNPKLHPPAEPFPADSPIGGWIDYDAPTGRIIVIGTHADGNVASKPAVMRRRSWRGFAPRSPMASFRRSVVPTSP